MHAQSIAVDLSAAHDARHGGAAVLRNALVESRRDTLATFSLLQAALPGLQVPQLPTLNPPLWELGHIGWFQEYWLSRNAQRLLGSRADPALPRLPGIRANADALYDSSAVAHASRWTLALPDADTTRAELAEQLNNTLALLDAISAKRADFSEDDALYFFRLALFHEDMHHEAALYMARSLGLPETNAHFWKGPLPAAPDALLLNAGHWRLGREHGAGFAFDNECGSIEVDIGECMIDAQVVRWAEYLPFVEENGYAQPSWWSEEGRKWLSSEAATGVTRQAPRYLRRRGANWEHWLGGVWQQLDLETPACHLTWFETSAWCRWAGRRLPTEAEWDYAARTRAYEFRWGDVWEWTSSPFSPYPGFSPHPYRDYSVPWFDGRPVLRGASFLTQVRMRHPSYRNFFPAHRNDIAAGFRSCRL